MLYIFLIFIFFFFFFQAEDGIRDKLVTGVQTCALPILSVEELKKEANGGHERFAGSLRKAVVEHARRAGAALVQLKSKLEHGKWSAWLRSEERRVGKECRSRWWADEEKKKEKKMEVVNM